MVTVSDWLMIALGLAGIISAIYWLLTRPYEEPNRPTKYINDETW